MEKEKTLSKKSILAYGFGEFSRQGSGIVQSTFLLFYLVNYAGLKATYVGIMMMLAKIWDAINDPIMGTIVDNTNSKYGKVRPYLLYCSIPSGLFLLMLFAVPSGMSDLAKMIWVTVAYVGTGMLMTMVDVPYNTLMVRVTDSSQERMRMARSKGLIGTLGVLLPSMVIPMITGKASNVGMAYTIGVGIFAALFAASYLIVFAGTRETITVQKENRLNIWDGLRTLFSNKYYVKMVLVYLVYGASYSITSGVMMFYVTAKYNNAMLTSILMVFMFISMMGATAVSKPLTDKLGKVKTVILGLLIGAIGLGLRVITRDFSPVIMIFGIFCYGIGASLYTTCLFPMTSETVDYGELKTGVRVESLSFAGMTLASKTGQGIATALIAFLLDTIGYVEGAGAQGESVVNGLMHIGATLPAVVLLAMVVVLLTYDMDKRHSQYKAQLEVNRIAKAGEE